MLPDISCTIDGIPVDIGAWSFSTTVNLGFDQLRAFAPKDQLRLIGGLGQGSEIEVRAANSENAIWAGRLATEPRYAEGQGEITARGYGYDAAKRTSRRLYQSVDYAMWEDAGGDTFTGGNSYRRILTTGLQGRLTWSVENSLALTSGANNASGYAFYAEGQQLKRIVFTAGKNADSNDLEFQIRYADGPGGTGTTSTAVAMTAAGFTSGDEIDHTLTDGTKDMIFLYVRCNNSDTTTSPYRFWAANVKVNALAMGVDPDVYRALDVMADVATDVGWSGAGVTTDSVLDNILPLDWEGPWSDLLTYVAEMEDFRWRVLDDRGSGPHLEYGAWTSDTWTTYTDRCSMDLLPMEVYNEVKVDYVNASGVNLAATATADPDPLAAKGLTNTYSVELGDAQYASSIADTMASTLVARLSQQRYTGRIQIASAWDDRGKDAPREIIAGDQLYIADFNEGEGQTFRVSGTEQTPEGVAVTVEDYLPTSALLAYGQARAAGWSWMDNRPPRRRRR